MSYSWETKRGGDSAGDRKSRTGKCYFWGVGITPRVKLELLYLSLHRWQAVCLDEGVEQRVGGGERMLRTLKVSDSKRGDRAPEVRLWFISSLGGHFDLNLRSLSGASTRNGTLVWPYLYVTQKQCSFLMNHINTCKTAKYPSFYWLKWPLHLSMNISVFRQSCGLFIVI